MRLYFTAWKSPPSRTDEGGGSPSHSSMSPLGRKVTGNFHIFIIAKNNAKFNTNFKISALCLMVKSTSVC